MAHAHPPPLRQMRGMWIASVNNINWPSAAARTPDAQRDEFRAWLDVAEAEGLNSVFVQIRPSADALWPSPYEPWSFYLTDTQGRDPGYDPLAFAVEETHRRGLAFHGWFNPYRVRQGAYPLAPGHPALQHPDWIVDYGGRLYYNPGLPQVRAFVQDAIMDAVTRYDLDGVHFDDYFYPVNTPAFGDAAAFAQHGAGFPDLASWRRANVDLMIQEMRQRVMAVKPEIAWGVGPSGIWRHRSSDPAGSDTAGNQSYDNLHADTRGWVLDGLLDYIAPQLYWHIGQAGSDYAVLTPWWAGVAAGTDVLLWIGQAAYKVGDPAQAQQWQQPGELSSHLHLNRNHPEVGGDLFYHAGQVRDDPLGSMSRVVADHYARPALPPLLPRLAGGAPPDPPAITKARRTATGVDLELAPAGPQPPRLYAIYRTASGAPDLTTARDLVAVVPGHTATWTDEGAGPGNTYHVTAVDPASRQSAPGRACRV